MAYSSVDLFVLGTNAVKVVARGGTRRQRGSAIGAAVRGKGLTRVSVSYSETYGFQSATYARYHA